MATYTKASGYYTLQLVVTESSTSTANNTSTLSLTLNLVTGSTYFSDVRVGYTVAVSGGAPNPAVNQNYSGAAQISMSKNQTKPLWSGTVTVAHNTDGTKSIAAGGITASINTQTGNIVPNISGLTNSSALALTTIPRQSTITTSASSNVMGNTRTITIARNSSSYTHTLTYAFGSASGTIATKTTSTSVSWTVPTSLAAQIATGSIRGDGTIYCKTYSGDTQIGTTTSASFVAQIPASTVALSSSSLAMGKTQTFTITRASTNLNHKITYTFGSASGTAVSSCTTSGTWTVPTSFVAQLTNAKSGTVTCVIETYNGTTSTAAAKVGSVTKTFTATIPAATVAATSTAMVMGTAYSGAVTVSGIHSNLRYTLTYTYGTATGSIGSAKTATTSFSFTPPTSLASQVASGNSSKTGTITCETFNGTASCGTTTATFTAKINASTVACNVSSVTMGGTAKFTITRSGSNLTHKLTYSFASGATTGTVVSSTSDTSYTWTVPTGLAAYVPSGSISAACVVTCTTYNGTASCGTSTVTISTVTIPVSTFSLSANNVTFGSTTGVTFTITRAASQLVHTLQYSLDNTNWTTMSSATRITATSYTWKPVASLASQVTGSSATWYVRVITYNFKDTSNYGLVGTKSSSITMKVSNSGDTAAPTLTMTPSSTTGTSYWQGIYIQGYSGVKTVLSATPHNATLASYSYKVGSVTRVNQTGRTDSSYSATDTYEPISGSGNITLTFTATDSHGFTSTTTATITVQAYALPVLQKRGTNSSIIVARANSSGTLVSDGTYLHIEVARKISQLKSGSTQLNYGRVQYQIGSGSWTDIGSVTTDATLDIPVQNINANLAVDQSYTVRLRVYDSFTGGTGSGTTPTQTYTIPTDKVVLDMEHFNAGDGLGLGMYAQGARLDVGFSESWFHNAAFVERLRSEKIVSPSNVRSTVIIAPSVSSGDIGLTTSATYPTFYTEWLKKICSEYPSSSNCIFLGRTVPNSHNITSAYIYNTSELQNGLPRYSEGIVVPYGGTTTRVGLYKFGTAEYSFYWRVVYSTYRAYAPLTYVQNDVFSDLGEISLHVGGNIACLRINSTMASATTSAYTTFATFDTQYAPVIGLFQSTFPQSNSYYTPIVFSVTTDGKLQVYKQNAGTGRIRFTMTWAFE